MEHPVLFKWSSCIPAEAVHFQKPVKLCSEIGGLSQCEALRFCRDLNELRCAPTAPHLPMLDGDFTSDLRGMNFLPQHSLGWAKPADVLPLEAPSKLWNAHFQKFSLFFGKEGASWAFGGKRVFSALTGGGAASCRIGMELLLPIPVDVMLYIELL